MNTKSLYGITPVIAGSMKLAKILINISEDRFNLTDFVEKEEIAFFTKREFFENLLSNW